MNILILFAHPERQSFNGALLNKAVETLTAEGHVVEVSDLYEMNFCAVGGKHDFVHDQISNPYNYREEQQFAYKNSSFSEDIAREQCHIIWSDALIIQCPMWCFSVPAVVKGWFDRVLTKDFAYGQDMEFSSGGMKKRQALLSLTTGGPKSIYVEGGMHGPIENYLYPITNGMLPYVGFKPLPPFISYAVEDVSDFTRAKYLDSFKKHLQSFFPSHSQVVVNL